MWWVVAVVAAVVLVATYLTWTASRVDRLHARAYAAYAALDAHLVRRAAEAATVAEAAQLADLMYAARVALDADSADRDVAENDLTRQLRAAVAGPAAELAAVPGPAPAGGLAAVGGPAAAEELVAVSRRVALARQVHNDVVRDALAVRRRVVVRALRLAAKHPEPAYFDVDDPTLPAAVPARSDIPAPAPVGDPGGNAAS